VDILFPDDIGWRKEKVIGEDRKEEKMRVVPLADIWFGHPLCDVSTLKSRLTWIANEPHVFCFFNGDGIFPVSGIRNKEDVKDEWDGRCGEFYGLINPIAHKLLWAQAGCFEDKMFETDYDPLKVYCGKDFWDVPYFRSPFSIGIHWAGNLFKFYCVHGRSSAQHQGTKANAMLRGISKIEHHDFIGTSHMRDSISVSPVRVIEDVVNFDLKRKNQYSFITSSFVQREDGEIVSREAKWDYPLPSRDQQNCALYKDGRCFLYRAPPTTNLVPL
jgi:hypothetical protein